MVHIHENPGMPETPEQNNNISNTSTPAEWKPPHHASNEKTSVKSFLEDDLNRQLWAGVLP
jgi:hypothetical protein